KFCSVGPGDVKARGGPSGANDQAQRCEGSAAVSEVGAASSDRVPAQQAATTKGSRAGGVIGMRLPARAGRKRGRTARLSCDENTRAGAAASRVVWKRAV